MPVPANLPDAQCLLPKLPCGNLESQLSCKQMGSSKINFNQSRLRNHCTISQQINAAHFYWISIMLLIKTLSMAAPNALRTTKHAVHAILHLIVLLDTMFWLSCNVWEPQAYIARYWVTQNLRLLTGCVSVVDYLCNANALELSRWWAQSRMWWP